MLLGKQIYELLPLQPVVSLHCGFGRLLLSLGSVILLLWLRGLGFVLLLSGRCLS